MASRWTQQTVDAVTDKKGVITPSSGAKPKAKPKKKKVIPPIPYVHTDILYVVGIDPGTKTGIGVYDRTLRKLIDVRTMDMYSAQKFILQLVHLYGKGRVYVRFEDARLRKFFKDGDARQARSGAGIREGVGSVKRDCTQWEDFLQAEQIPYQNLSPRKGSTKLEAPYFQKLTGWEGSSSEHSRDGAMLCFRFIPKPFLPPKP